MLGHRNLPIFSYQEKTLIKRVTIISVKGIIKKYFYPVFPPDKNAAEVSLWLRENRKSRDRG